MKTKLALLLALLMLFATFLALAEDDPDLEAPAENTIELEELRELYAVDREYAYYDKVEYFMDPDYWRSYNIIEPSESLDKAIRKLVSRYRRN